LEKLTLLSGSERRGGSIGKGGECQPNDDVKGQNQIMMRALILRGRVGGGERIRTLSRGESYHYYWGGGVFFLFGNLLKANEGKQTCEKSKTRGKRERIIPL